MRLSSTTGELALRRGSDAEAIRALARAGFDACDFSLWNYPWQGGVFGMPEETFDAYFTDLRTLCRRCGIAVEQTHAPFTTKADAPVADADRLRVLRRSIRATALLGASVVVVHPLPPDRYDTETARQTALAENLAMYRKVGPDLKRHQVQIAIENMFDWDGLTGRARPTLFSTAQSMTEALAQLGAKHFCACLDIGHAPLVGQDPAQMIRALGSWLKALHVHDNDGVMDLHTLPYLGRTDWTRVCEALAAVQYPGALSLEAVAFPVGFPSEMEDAALRLMAETAANLRARILEPRGF